MRSARSRGQRIRFRILRSDSRPVPDAEVPVRFRMSCRAGHDTEPRLRRRRAVLARHDPWYRRSAVVPVRARPVVKPAAARPSPGLRSPVPGRLVGLRAFRFLGRFRFGGPLGAPFFSLLRGGCQVCQLTVGPCFACLPQGIHPAAKLTAGIDLVPHQFGLFDSKETGARLACDGMREAVVGTVTRLGIFRTSATWFAALDGAFGERAAAHRLGVA
jgi:hypothetical protein